MAFASHVKSLIAGIILFSAVMISGSASPSGKIVSPTDPVVIGLDHIPIAVADLEGAATRYRQLGFTLKPGRLHANGIRNYHAKFPDGSEIELITAPEATDELTAEYRDYLQRGDGPAFLSLFVPNTPDLVAILESTGLGFSRTGGMVAFNPGSALRYLFFGTRNKSPTDRPEHFDHPNGATRLVAVWLAGDDMSPEFDLFEKLNLSVATVQGQTPGSDPLRSVRLPEGEIILFPSSHQIVSDRKIIGATIQVSDLHAVEEFLEETEIPVSRQGLLPFPDCVVVAPGFTHGLWLAFCQAD